MKESNIAGTPKKPAKPPQKRGWLGVVTKVKRELQERQTRKQEESPADRAARITASATRSIAWLTAAVCLIALIQLLEIIEGGADTKAIADAAQKQVCAANRSADAAQQFADTAGDINGSIENAVMKLDAQAKVSAASVKATQDAMRLDQRAWVFATNFHLSAEPEAGQPITVTMTIVNSGKTPALDSVPMTHPSDFPSDPPDVADWDTVAQGTNKRGLVSPGMTGLTVTTAPLTLVNGLNAYNAGVNSIYVQAKITYFDTFNKPHWTTVCVLHHHGKPPGEFEMCERGNDVDR
jgi:hypothetical protein